MISDDIRPALAFALGMAKRTEAVRASLAAHLAGGDIPAAHLKSINGMIERSGYSLDDDSAAFVVDLGRRISRAKQPVHAALHYALAGEWRKCQRSDLNVVTRILGAMPAYPMRLAMRRDLSKLAALAKQCKS